MKNVKSALYTSLIASLFFASLLFHAQSHAQSAASEHSGLASKHSALAASHTVTSTAEVASAVVAVPLVSVGAVSLATGSALVATGEAMADAIDNCDVPLVVTDKVITLDPAPDKVVIQVR